MVKPKPKVSTALMETLPKHHGSKLFGKKLFSKGIGKPLEIIPSKKKSHKVIFFIEALIVLLNDEVFSCLGTDWNYYFLNTVLPKIVFYNDILLAKNYILCWIIKIYHVQIFSEIKTFYHDSNSKHIVW